MKARWLAAAMLIAMSATAAVQAQVADPKTLPNPSSTEELRVLKTQIATTQEYQDQFISIVQWSLGAVLAMALGLAAFNWYSSKASYERDIQSLRQENRALHAELTALIRTEADASAKRLTDGLSARQVEIQAAVSKALEQKLAKQSSDISEVKTDVLDLQYRETQREAKEAARDKNYSWAIYTYSELLGISVRQGSDHYQVGEILDEIGKLLDNPATALSADNVTEVVESLKRLPQRYQAAAQNLIPRINRAHR
jgi:hypothetical protein